MNEPVIAYCFDNGMLMVFDSNGEQVPEYQGYITENYQKLKQDYPECEILPGRLI